ncbi:MAG: hypothetical protein JST16_03020 [Bdellovibrionales bacterium]|nr:hypothetical protein [Bdellovibrionales bacterium]
MRYLLHAVVFIGFAVHAADMEDLHREVERVCPISGLSGNPADPRHIRIDFKPEATPEQRAAAIAIRNSFDHRSAGLAELDDQLDRLASRAANAAAVSEATFQVVYSKVQRAKLVADVNVKKRLIQEIDALISSSGK